MREPLTIEEAIEKLEYDKKKNQREDDGNEEYWEAVDMAIEALEKQMAIRPERIPADDEGLYFDIICPTCGEILNERRKGVYCRCGQKLDWSHED